MVSPFPGMDPFLEHPDLFPGLHYRFVGRLGDSLQKRLRLPYYVEFNERVWVEVSQRPIGPDVSVLRARSKARRANGAVAVAARSKPIVVRIPHDERTEAFIEIRHRRKGGDRLVTSIEVLSPTNKTPGEHGRNLYIRKQEEVLASETNLVEIDLLRGGEHSTAVLLEWARARMGRYDYHACVNCFEDREAYQLYPIRLEEPLPEIDIPLLPGDSPVPADLQAVFDDSYDAGAYDRRLRYVREELVPPLPPRRMEWVRQVLRAAKRVPEGNGQRRPKRRR